MDAGLQGDVPDVVPGSEEAINLLIAAQRTCEELYISQGEPKLLVLPLEEQKESSQT